MHPQAGPLPPPAHGQIVIKSVTTFLKLLNPIFIWLFVHVIISGMAGKRSGQNYLVGNGAQQVHKPIRARGRQMFRDLGTHN